MSRLTNFGQQFAQKVLEKTYQNSIVDSVTNRMYEGEIKKPGDRVNILSFLNSGTLSDYVVGTDMTSEALVDTQDQLVVEKRRFWNFSLDRLEDQFTYADDIVDHIANDYAKMLEKEIDTYILQKGPQAKVSSWVGTNLTVNGSGQTMASIATSATGGTITINGNFDNPATFGGVENPVDGLTYGGGFETADIGKGVRLMSTSSFVSPVYLITAITSTVAASITEWDGAVSGPEFEEGFTLRGLFGGDGINFPKGGSGDASLLTMSSLGWQFIAAAATSVSSASIYNQVTLLAEQLDGNEVDNVDRHLTVPQQLITQLKQSSALQPTGIAEIFTGTVINGRVMRVGAFDVHLAAGARVSSRAGKSTATGTGSDTVLTAGPTGFQILANHTGMITFAEKWSESRVVDAENQFAKKYQGLFLYGALVPAYRRKYGAILFGSF